MVTLWDGTEIPSNASDIETVQLSIQGGRFKQPVWVDLITGNIYEIPVEQMTLHGETATFKDVPVYDGPAVITDKSLLTFVPARESKKSAKSAPAVQPKKPVKLVAPKIASHLLPGTQQPAPAVLICAGQGEDASAWVKWLNSQEVHAFVVQDGGQSASDALHYIRSRSAEWQVRTGSVGVMGAGTRNAEAALAVLGEADFAILLDADDTRVPAAQRKRVFAGKRAGFEKPLAAWLEQYKGKVF